MAGGMAATTRFIGIISGVAGLGAVLATVTDATLRKWGAPRVPGQIVDWHALSLRVVAGDADGALSALPVAIRSALADAVHDSVAAGFGAALTVAAIIALAAAALSWWLVRTPESRGATLR